MCDDIDILQSLFDSSSEESNESIDEILLCESDSSADSAEEKLIAFCTRPPKRQCLRNYLEEIVPSYSEEEFIHHFRLSKPLYERLCQEFQSSSTYQKLRPDKRCSAEIHLPVFLWFAGHENCSFRDLGVRFCLSTSTVSRIIDRTIDYISGLAPVTIQWPSEERMKQTSSFFQTKAGFPNVIGAIDVTRIDIDPSNSEKKDRKGNVYLCLQAICDERKKFLDIFVALPGSSEDSSIFQDSLIYPKLEELCGNYHIVGDSTYPCSRNLLNPYSNNAHLSRSQKMYNIKLETCRVVIKHTLSILKQRFRQLNHCKIRGTKKLFDFVQACCVLHNLADESDLDFTKDISPADIQQSSIAVESSSGKHFRDEICKELCTLK